MRKQFTFILLLCSLFAQAQSSNVTATKIRAEESLRIGTTASQKVTGFDLTMPGTATHTKLPTTKCVYDWVTGNVVLSGATANGDLAGNFPNPTVDGLMGRSLSGTAPNLLDVLKWSGSQWVPLPDNSGVSDGLGTGFTSGGGSGHIPGATNITVDSLTTFLQGTYGQLHFDVPTHFDGTSFFQSGAEFNGDTYFDLSPQFNGGLNAPFFQTSGANGGVGISGDVSVDGEEKLNLYVNDNVKMTLTTSGIEFPAGTIASLLGDLTFATSSGLTTLYLGDLGSNISMSDGADIGSSIQVSSANVSIFSEDLGSGQTSSLGFSPAGFTMTGEDVSIQGNASIIVSSGNGTGMKYSSDYSATLTDPRAVPDIGINRKMFGYSASTTATTSAGGELTITHGVGTTPTVITATYVGNNAYACTITNKGATTFKVKVWDSAGASVNSTSVTVDWYAR